MDCIFFFLRHQSSFSSSAPTLARADSCDIASLTIFSPHEQFSSISRGFKGSFGCLSPHYQIQLLESHFAVSIDNAHHPSSLFSLLRSAGARSPFYHHHAPALRSSDRRLPQWSLYYDCGSINSCGRQAARASRAAKGQRWWWWWFFWRWWWSFWWCWVWWALRRSRVLLKNGSIDHGLAVQLKGQCFCVIVPKKCWDKKSITRFINMCCVLRDSNAMW